MTDDQQKQPEFANSEPQTPLEPDELAPSGTGLEITGRTTKLSRKPEQPFLKAQSIKILRGTIGLLESVVDKLEAEPVSQLPPTAMPPTTTLAPAPPILETTATLEPESVSRVEEPTTEPPILETTATPEPEPVSRVEEPISVAESSLDTPVAAPKPIEPKPTVKPPQLTKPKLTDRILPSFSRLQAFWDGTLIRVRSLLPATWNEKLSDWALTSAIAGIVVVLLITTAALLPETPAQVAKVPPNEINTPPELKAPQPPQPVEVEPPPPPELTPEESLIAAIQNQVAEVTQQYGNGLIQSIEANFQGSRLIVKVTDGWYKLKEAQQNKLADDMLRRSNELDFSKLEITNLEGTLLARSPVVGANMVILKRQELTATL